MRYLYFASFIKSNNTTDEIINHWTGNISYNVPINGRVVKSLTFYNDYGVILKEEDSFEDSHLNILGCLVKAVPVSIFIEFIAGKNMPYVGSPTGSAFALGNSNADWEKMFNINLSY